MLIDSNIIVYASLPEYSWLNEQLEQGQPFVSVVSYVEVLGFHKLHEAEKNFFEQFFDLAWLLPIDHKTLQGAVHLRQMRKMALGDSLIAATAIVHGLPLMTVMSGILAGYLTLW